MIVQAAVSVASGHSVRLLELGEQVGLGSWEWVPVTGEQRWSDDLFRLFGLDEPGTFTPTLEYMLERTHRGDRERVARYVESARTLANPAPIEDLFWLLINQPPPLHA